MNRVLMLLLLSLVLCHAASAADPPRRSASSEVDREMEALLTVTEYAQMGSLIGHWREKLPQADRKQLLALLLRHLGSAKKLPLMHPERVIVSQTRKPGAVEGKDQVVVRQDVFTEGGRAAWAVEQLLDCSLPVISGKLSPQDRQEQVRKTYEKVVETLLMPLAMLNAKERAKLAASETDKQTLAKLAADTDVAVRRAAAANRHTPVWILGNFLRDPDPQIRDAANDNLSWSRTIKDE